MRCSIGCGPAWKGSHFASLVLALGLAGCGSGGFYPVRGKVTYEDGTPLWDGVVILERTEGDKPITGRGDIQADGTYQVSTHQPRDGALPGRYRVLISVPPAAKGSRPPEIDRTFMDFTTSGLTYEVKPEPNEFPIRVTRPAKSPRGAPP